MNVLDLFSGIGGFSLGLERAGMRTVAFCEIEPYCRAVLSERWPGVQCYGDIRELDAAQLAFDGITVDVICGGFPCQDISAAGPRIGIGGPRSGLWREYARLIRELRPQFVIVENVSDLLTRGIESVLGDLAEIRYDAEWHCIPASVIGAPHRRDRVWILAYPQGERLERRPSIWDEVQAARGRLLLARQGQLNREDQWAVEPNVGRVAHGIPARVERLRSLGNAVVPQIPEIIGRAIMRSARTSSTEPT